MLSYLGSLDRLSYDGDGRSRFFREYSKFK